MITEKGDFLMDIKLPVGVAIRVDDVAWFEGADDRHLSRPSRSGRRAG